MAETVMSPAARDVVAERARQIEAEGWSTDHDDCHEDGQLADAAACYAAGKVYRADKHGSVLKVWPWSWDWWKPQDRRRNLVRAGALILAEIERLDRMEAEQDG